MDVGGIGGLGIEKVELIPLSGLPSIQCKDGGVAVNRKPLKIVNPLIF